MTNSLVIKGARNLAERIWREPNDLARRPNPAGRTSPWIRSQWTPPPRRPKPGSRFLPPALCPSRPPLLSEPRTATSAWQLRGCARKPTPPLRPGAQLRRGRVATGGLSGFLADGARVKERRARARFHGDAAVRGEARTQRRRPGVGAVGSGGGRRVRGELAGARGCGGQEVGCGRAGGRGRPSPVGWLVRARSPLLRAVGPGVSVSRPA
jgi:hypothetical protein